MGIHSQVSADTFVDAHRINQERYRHERTESQSLVHELQAKGEPIEGIEPEFWDGCMDGNNRAYATYRDTPDIATAASDLREVLKTDLSNDGAYPKVYVEGYRESLKKWAEALEKNSPDVVVYW